MARILKKEKYTVRLTEQTVRELLIAIEEGKKNPSLDTIDITSDYSDVAFEIDLEIKPHSQESLGYKMTGGGGNLSFSGTIN